MFPNGYEHWITSELKLLNELGCSVWLVTQSADPEDCQNKICIIYGKLKVLLISSCGYDDSSSVILGNSY